MQLEWEVPASKWFVWYFYSEDVQTQIPFSLFILTPRLFFSTLYIETMLVFKVNALIKGSLGIAVKPLSKGKFKCSILIRRHGCHTRPKDEGHNELQHLFHALYVFSSTTGNQCVLDS